MKPALLILWGLMLAHQAAQGVLGAMPGPKADRPSTGIIIRWSWSPIMTPWPMLPG